MKTSELLASSRALIPTEERWTKGSFARDHWRDAVNILDPDATCFCASGAIHLASVGAPDHKWGAHFFLADAIREMTGAEPHDGLPPEAMQIIFSFNDSASHSDVLRAFDRAIEIAKEREES